MATTFYLIRHGETDWNGKNMILGQSDVPLNETGRQQAEVAAAYLAGLPLTMLYTSDLTRTRQTADAIARALPGIPVTPDRRLREKDAGLAEGMTFEAAQQRWPHYLEQVRRDPLYTRPEGGESVADVISRVIEALTELAERHPNQAVGVVTHGGPVRMAVLHVLGLGVEQLGRFEVDNCSVTVIAWSDRPKLIALNSLGDLCRFLPLAVRP